MPALAAALLTLGYSRGQAVAIATSTGLVEPVAGLVGVVAVTMPEALLPWGTGIRRRRDDLRRQRQDHPETHRRDHQNQATAGLMIGFVLMMYLDVVLG